MLNAFRSLLQVNALGTRFRTFSETRNPSLFCSRSSASDSKLAIANWAKRNFLWRLYEFQSNGLLLFVNYADLFSQRAASMQDWQSTPLSSCDCILRRAKVRANRYEFQISKQNERQVRCGSSPEAVLRSSRTNTCYKALLLQAIRQSELEVDLKVAGCVAHENRNLNSHVAQVGRMASSLPFKACGHLIELIFGQSLRPM